MVEVHLHIKQRCTGIIELYKNWIYVMYLLNEETNTWITGVTHYEIKRKVTWIFYAKKTSMELLDIR